MMRNDKQKYDELHNPDGCAWYSPDGRQLLEYVGESSVYQVADGCESIAKKAFAYCTSIKEVVLPDSVTTIEPMAFLAAGIQCFRAGKGLRELGDKAFYQCRSLESVFLNEGLEVIGQEALVGCAVTALCIPSTVRCIGNEVLARRGEATEGFRGYLLNPQNPYFLMDEAGCLYRHTDRGLVLQDASQVSAKRLSTHPDTALIESRAFGSNRILEELTITEGVEEIADHAFLRCTKLRALHLPVSLKRIGAQALEGTSLEYLFIPKNVECIAETAFGGTCVHGIESLSLKKMEVDPENARYYMDGGILCERLGDGACKALVYASEDPVARIPLNAVELGSFLFGGTSVVEELHIHDRTLRWSPSSFTMGLPAGEVYYHLFKPLAGHSVIHARFPRRLEHFPLFFQALSDVPIDVGRMLGLSDEAESRDNDDYRRWSYMAERLVDPFLIGEAEFQAFHYILRANTMDACREFAKNRHWDGFEHLFKLGILNAGNVDGAVDAVSEVGEVESTAFFIEAKHRYLGAVSFDLGDYDL